MKAWHTTAAGAKLLSADEERSLAARIAEGDAEARDQLVCANFRLVISLSRLFIGRGVAHEDLVAEGNLGLLRAAEGYDGRSSVRFATYASFWIKQAMRRIVINHGPLVRLPQYTVTLVAKWRRTQAKLAEQLGRQPTVDETGSALGLSRAKRRTAQEILKAAALTRYGAEGSELSELVSSGEPAPDETIAKAEEWALALAGLDGLNPREAAILRMLYGIDTGEPLTRAEAGRRLGLTREWVRRLERQAIERLANNACGTAEATTMGRGIPGAEGSEADFRRKKGSRAVVRLPGTSERLESGA
jgi:RNA polymerase primary sigma factor